MTRSRPSPRCRRALQGAVLAATSLLALAAACGAAEAPRAPHVGLVVFIASQGDVETSLPTGELRRIVEGCLAGRLAGAGAVVHGGDELGAAVRGHRVRTSLLVNHAFLTEVGRDPGLDRLALVDVIILPDNLLLAVRDLTVADGFLQQVGLVDLDLGDADLLATDATAADLWRASLAQLCADLPLAVAAPRTPGREVLPFLPFDAYGSDEVVATVAGIMLLREALSDTAVAIPDPSLVVTTLHGAGLDAHLLSAAGRELLVTRFACRRLVHPVLVSYAESARGANAGIPDFDDRVHENILLASGVLSLWDVALAAGELVRSVDHYFELRRETGWFGIEDKRSPVIQLEAAIGGLWSSFAASLEES